jgi:hypothetical protein
MSKSLLIAFVLVAALPLAVGCGSTQSSARPDIDAIPDEEHHGKLTKVLVYEFRAHVRKGGVEAAKRELPELLENFEGYENRKLGDHAATYKEIVEKLKAMEASLGSAARESVVKAADEVGTLADKLPGEANPNPEVE